MIAALIALVVALGGASVAAQSSLPGDALYPIKVNINESIREALTFSQQGKADYEAARAQERLAEAEKLSQEASVSADTQAQIQANFKAFADRTQQRISDLATVDARAAADVASNFETALAVHEKILARLSADSKETNAELHNLEVEVDNQLSDTVKARTHAEADVKTEDHSPDVQAAAQGKLTAAANVIAEVTSFINDNKDKLGADAVVKAQAQLTAAQTLLTQANAKLTAGDYAGAFTLGNQVIRTAQGAKDLIQAQDDLEVDLHLDGRASRSVQPTPEDSGLQESEDHGGSAGAHANVQVGF